MLTHRTLNHVVDTIFNPVYDRAKWQKHLARAEQYSKSHPTSPVKAIRLQENNIYFVQFKLDLENGQHGWMLVSFPFPDVARVQAGLGEAPAVNSSGEKLRVDEIGNALLISGPAAKVRLVLAPFSIEFQDAQGKPLLGSATGSGLGIGDGLCRQQLEIGRDEGFFGLGEQYGEFNHRGQVLVMDQEDAYESETGNTYLPIPFLLSQKFGLLVNTYQSAVFDLGKSDPGSFSFVNPSSSIDYFVFLSPSPKQGLQEYTALIGRSPLVPRWSLEPWISRQTIVGWRTGADAARDVDCMLAEGFPLGVVLYENLLSGPADGPDLGIDPKTKPDMPAIIDHWHALGLKVVGWASSGQISPYPGAIKYYGLDRHPEYLVRNLDGSMYLGGIGKNMAYIDVTNPEALAYAWEKIYSPLFIAEPDGKASYTKINLDGIKPDFCEFFPRDDVPVLVHERRPGLNLYAPTFFSEWIYNQINLVRPEGGITWTRGAGLGAQRTGFVWTGDRGRTFSQLRAHALRAHERGCKRYRSDRHGPRRIFRRRDRLRAGI